MAKPTDAELERCVSAVYKLILRGADRARIVRYAAKNWQVESRAVDGYIARAKTLLRKQADADRADELGKARARLNMLFAMTLRGENPDVRTALAVQKELNALADFYPADETTLKRLLAQAGLSNISLIMDVLKAFADSDKNAQDIFARLLAKLQEENGTHET